MALITEQIAQYKADGEQCQIVLRDVTKAFDKVWHCGIKYKILHLKLPTIIEKILCDFLVYHTASIRIKNHVGPPFNLSYGVPQGSVISPILYTIYTNDIENSMRNLNICYADDISQVVAYHGKSKKNMNLLTEREINTVNHYENKWKIRTNLTKFTPIHLGAKKTIPLNSNDDQIEFKISGMCLGIKITSSGYYKHIEGRRKKALTALKKLYKLYHMPVKIKTHLIKALILPILDYPPIPTHTMSNTQI